MPEAGKRKYTHTNTLGKHKRKKKKKISVRQQLCECINIKEWDSETV